MKSITIKFYYFREKIRILRTASFFLFEIFFISLPSEFERKHFKTIAKNEFCLIKFVYDAHDARFKRETAFNLQITMYTKYSSLKK